MRRSARVELGATPAIRTSIPPHSHTPAPISFGKRSGTPLFEPRTDHRQGQEHNHERYRQDPDDTEHPPRGGKQRRRTSGQSSTTMRTEHGVGNCCAATMRTQNRSQLRLRTPRQRPLRIDRPSAPSRAQRTYRLSRRIYILAPDTTPFFVAHVRLPTPLPVLVPPRLFGRAGHLA